MSVLSEYLPDAQCTPAAEEHWGTEFLSLTIALKCVDSLEEAVEHINQHGCHISVYLAASRSLSPRSGHTDCIVTESTENAEYFMRQVDSAGVTL